jgi:hypothetical protein
MTNTDFDFDALPGDRPAVQEQPAPAPVERPRRGPKKGSKRGPRRVAPGDAQPTINAMLAKAKAATIVAFDAAQDLSLEPDLGPEYVFIRQMMKLPDVVRIKVLAVLNKVFG